MSCCPPTARRLFNGESVTISGFCCRPDSRERGPEEWSHRPGVALVRRGAFTRHGRGGDITADPNLAMFFRHEDAYRVSHPDPHGDDCTSVTPSPGLLVSLLREHDPKALDAPAPTFQVTHGPVSPREFGRYIRLLRTLEAATIDEIQVEEDAISLLGDVFAGVCGSRNGAPVRVSRMDTASARREWVNGVQRLLSERIGERLTLGQIAQAVHCSAFHLARVFREETGMPVHRYLQSLRLRRALERLDRGETDLSRLAMALGFFDHSHFTNSFRREFGVAPSRWAALSGATRRQMSKRFQV